DLELFGMRFGLDRMHKLMTALGMPQRRFASIHAVGTNGKSSTVRFIAGILERHGIRTGSYTSPHLASFTERSEVGERPVSGADFAAAVTGELHPEAQAVAERVTAERHALRVRADESEPSYELAARGAFQRANFALARAAAEAFLGELDEDAVRRAAAEVQVPGRMQVVGERPLTVLDGAHNPAGAQAVADALPEVLDGRRAVGVIGVLDDKDAAGMLRSL